MLIFSPLRFGLRPSHPFRIIADYTCRGLSCSAVLEARKVLKQFKLADIGEGITECEVIKWYGSCVLVIKMINYDSLKGSKAF